MSSHPGAIASAVRDQLDEAELSGRQLAAQIGMTPWSLQRRLSGKVPFSGDDLIAVAGVLDVPVEQFFIKAAA